MIELIKRTKFIGRKNDCKFSETVGLLFQVEKFQYFRSDLQNAHKIDSLLFVNMLLSQFVFHQSNS